MACPYTGLYHCGPATEQGSVARARSCYDGDAVGVPVGGEVPGADTEVLGLTVGVGPGAVAGVVDGEGRAVGFGVLVGVAVGVGEVDGDPEPG